MRSFMRQLAPAVIAVLVFTVICGFIYPLVVTGVAQVAWHDKANGSLIKKDGVVVGSSLIGQQFADDKYFHPRPSAAGTGYDGLSSSFSNLGPTNPDFLKSIEERVSAYRTENNLPDTQQVPVDAVTASASGLDPDISVANAKFQAPRVAEARGSDGRRGSGAGESEHQRPPMGLPRRARCQRSETEPRPRQGLDQAHWRHGPRHAAHLSRSRPGRRQDLRHARRGLAPPQSRHRRRHRQGHNARTQEHDRPDPRSRDRAAAPAHLPRRRVRRDGRRCRPRAEAGGLSRR